MATKASSKTAETRGKISRGESYVCDECGLAVTVDEVCGCVETCDIVCCGTPMKKKATRARPAKK